MTKNKWKKLILEQMSALGVQKDAYDSAMETLAGILEQRDKTFGESRASGGKSVIGLSRYQAEICVLEKGEDVCTGTSKANSAIVRGGFAENAEKNGVEFKFECGVQNMISSSQTSVCT